MTTITTPDAVPGEVIEAAWGDAVRADLMALNADKYERSGGVITGMVSVGADAGAGNTVAGHRLEPDGRFQSLHNVQNQGNIALNRTLAAAIANGQAFMGFSRNSVLIGNITIATTTSVAYNTTSDGRLKTVSRAVDGDEALAKINATEPVHYTWTANPEDGEQVGFIAQDLDAVAPEVVTAGHGEPGDDGFVPWSTHLTELVPTLVAAIQALTRRVETLEAAGV